MVNIAECIEKDLQHIWHPCMQMKDFETSPPLLVYAAEGSFIYSNQGRLIDSMSSWWCKSLGHRHPRVQAAITEQLQKFEHVIAAHTTHPLLADFGSKIAEITGNQHVFFANDGASAVEIALKLCYQAMQHRGMAHKKEFIALTHAYHGESLGCLSVSDLDTYKRSYQHLGYTCHHIPIPLVTGMNDPLWHDAQEYWQALEPQLAQWQDKVCAIIVEPIIQGSAGMRIYSADFLFRLSRWAKEHDIYCIADEIFTGLCRTGPWLASQHARIQPDIICLSKGLTSGSLPLSIVAIDHAIYELFYADYEQGKSFLHSHTFSGHALAVAAGLATIQVMEETNISKQVIQLEEWMSHCFIEIAAATKKISNIRYLGAVIAAELVPNGEKRLGYKLYQAALERGALIRPIGNTLYWVPPLNSSKETIVQLGEITLNSIMDIY